MPTPQIQEELGTLLAAVTDLARRLNDGGSDSSRWAATRLAASVIRPLRDARSRLGGDDGSSVVPSPVVAEDLASLATAATNVRLHESDVPELLEAAAALQQLAITMTPADAAAATATDLWQLEASLPRSIRVASNGPYLMTNVENVSDWLGQAVSALPQMALCRCGRSAMKPLCDGTHAETGFTDAKSADRVPDRRETYVGLQLTILDNRGTCQHSGYCTDRLSAVFHSESEPFVTPSGGRMDEVIRAVRDCPSGALSYAIDGIEARDQVDYGWTRRPAIEVSKDGPYRVTGGIPLTDAAGNEHERNEGASREHYALCRCGQSQNKPFCSGMHWYVDFHDPVPAADHEPTIFEWCGGLPALTRMTRRFYEKHVPEDPLLAPLFADMSPDHPERVAAWLGEVFGGPHGYSSAYGGYPRMVSRHVGKGLTEGQRARWVELLLRSAGEAGLPNDPEFRSAFGSYIEWGSRLAVENSQPGYRPPERMPMPSWDWNTAAGPPGSRIAAAPPDAEATTAVITMPAAGEPVSFDAHIKPLFRAQDRRSMKFAFDLWSYDDVASHADAILDRLHEGSMPCDGPWDQTRVDMFRRWVDGGKLP